MSYKITIGPVRCIFTGFSKAQLAEIKEEFTIKGEFVPLKGHSHTARQSYPLFGYNPASLTGFAYSGFFIDVLGYVVNEMGIVPQIEDTRIHLKTPKPDISYDFFSSPLFPHQKEALDAILSSGVERDYHGIRMVWPCGIINAAPNAGKDALMLGIMANYPDAKVLMLVSEPKIAAKAIKEFTQNGIQVTPIITGNTPSSRQQLKRVAVGTPKVFGNEVFTKSKLWLAKEFDILLVDECHQISDQFLQVLEAIDAPIRYGMSGTALKSSNPIARAKVKQSLGKVLYDITPKQLVAANVSRRIDVYIHNADIAQYMTQKRIYETQSSDYGKIERLLYIDNEYLHQQIVNLIDDTCLKAGKTVPTVIFVNKLEHGYKLLDRLRAASYKAVFANGQGSNSNARIAAAIADFNAGKIDVLIGNSVISTGHNINYMENVVIACGGKSNIQLVQRLGRANRRKDGHDSIPVHDFYMGNKIMDRHLRIRYKAYLEEGYPVFFTYKHNPSTLTPIYGKSKEK